MVKIESLLPKGPGMFRHSLAFLSNAELKISFHEEIRKVITEIPIDWNPHRRLEFFKVMIRTNLKEYSSKFNRKFYDTLRSTRNELDRLNDPNVCPVTKAWQERKGGLGEQRNTVKNSKKGGSLAAQHTFIHFFKI